MILWGWMRRPTILGLKMDQCDGCGAVAHHALVRSSYWFHLFWVPVVLFRLKHELVCTECADATGMSFGQARGAFKAAELPVLGRVRSAWPAIQEELWRSTGHRPTENEVFDPIVRNPRRGFFDFYVKAWPALVAALLLFAILMPRQLAAVTGQPEQYGSPHTCWSDTATGDLVGCRLANGTIKGHQGPVTFTCYFDEPMRANVEYMCR